MSTPLISTYATIGDLMLSASEPGGVTWVLADIAGWGSPKPTISVVQKPRAHGAWAGSSFLTARTLTLTGTVFTDVAGTLSDAVDRLNAAVSLTGTLLTVVEDGRARSMTVYRQDEVLVTWTGDRSADFSVQVVALDPRKYGQQIVASTKLPATTGGFSWPYSYPYSYTGTVVSGQIGISNPGNIASPVRMRIDGPCIGPIVTHVSSGAELVFSSAYTIPGGNWLDIDMDKRTVLENGQASRNGYITSRGWFALDPGDNTIGFNASVFNSASLLTVTATPAWE